MDWNMKGAQRSCVRPLEFSLWAKGCPRVLGAGRGPGLSPHSASQSRGTFPHLEKGDDRLLLRELGRSSDGTAGNSWGSSGSFSNFGVLEDVHQW